VELQSEVRNVLTNNRRCNGLGVGKTPRRGATNDKTGRRIRERLNEIRFYEGFRVRIFFPVPEDIKSKIGARPAGL